VKIKVFTYVDERAGREPLLDVDDAADHYRIRVKIGEDEFEVSADRDGRLVLRHPEGKQITVRPVGANEIRITADPWS
jgi:hypothetical protein